MRTLVLCAAVPVSCGGTVACEDGNNRDKAGAGGSDAGRTVTGMGGATAGSGPVAVTGGAANGGRGGSFPSSLRDASAVGTSGRAGSPADGAPPVCPIQVSGTQLTEADCYACIRSDQCESAPGVVFTPEGCLRSIELPSLAWCIWYTDDAPVGLGRAVSCNTNPGRVDCGTSL